MLGRIKMLKSEIERLQKLAASTDGNVAREFMSLIKRMQDLVDQLEEDAKRVEVQRTD